jgi:hypothetical protein
VLQALVRCVALPLHHWDPRVGAPLCLPRPGVGVCVRVRVHVCMHAGVCLPPDRNRSVTKILLGDNKLNDADEHNRAMDALAEVMLTNDVLEVGGGRGMYVPRGFWGGLRAVRECARVCWGTKCTALVAVVLAQHCVFLPLSTLAVRRRCTCTRTGYVSQPPWAFAYVR